MKKKIMVFMLLLSFLVGTFGAVPVKAGEVEDYSITFDANNNSLVDKEGNYITLSDEHISDLNNGYGILLFCTDSDENGRYFVIVYTFSNEYEPAVMLDDSGVYRLYFYDVSSDFRGSAESIDGKLTVFQYNVNEVDSSRFSQYYGCRSGALTTSYFAHSSDCYFSFTNASYRPTFLYSSNDILALDESYNLTETVYFGASVEPYTFENWCTDSGLTCAASSNESSSVIPFWYEPDSYNYIVRKTLTASSTSGVYQLTMLQRNSSSGYYPYYFEVNNLGYLGVAGAFSDTSAFTVRNFYYDADGNGWKLQDKFDISDLPYDHTNVTFDENVVFIYSDTDIYADREASSIWQAASAEYYNVDIPEPEITRVPIGGGTTVGGSGKPGGLLDFVITFITLVWTDLFAVEVPVDGYMISFQQIVIYGALAGVLGWLFYRLFKKG